MTYQTRPVSKQFEDGHIISVGVTRQLPAQTEARLAELFSLLPSRNEDNVALTQEQLVALADAADIFCPTLGDQLDADFFARLTSPPKLIANFGAGVDHIDIAAAMARGIKVTNTPSVLAEDAADMAMALILAVPRRLVEGVKVLEEGGFSGWTPTWMLGRQIRGKKLGIIGLGRVGQAIAKRARAFGLDVHYHNRTQINALMAEELEATYWESLDQMIAHVDIISVNCPHTPATYHLLSRRRLALLKPEAYLVNISRGEIIDEEALGDMIVAGTLAGAALDVYEQEPKVDEKLSAAPNVVLIPHMASATIEARLAMGERMMINMKMFVDGHNPPDRVIPDIL